MGYIGTNTVSQLGLKLNITPVLPYRLMMPGTVAPKFRFRGKGKMSVVQGRRNRGVGGRVGAD